MGGKNIFIGINTKLDKVAPIIIATGVLHNILRRAGEPEPPDDQALPLPMQWEALIEYGQINNDRQVRQGGRIVDPHRQALISNYFSTLNAMQQQ